MFRHRPRYEYDTGVRRQRSWPVACAALALAFTSGACAGAIDVGQQIDRQPATYEHNTNQAVATTSEALSSAPNQESQVQPQACKLKDSPNVQKVAASIISTFENSTTEVQYDYIENIKDKRGFTAGRAGFTSGTMDMLELVKEYTKAAPGNPLEKYIPALSAIGDRYAKSGYNEQSNPAEGDVSGLEGLVEAWHAAAKDPNFIQAQDAIFNKLYLVPTIQVAEENGIKTNLGQLILLDSSIQHGLEGMKKIAADTNKKLANTEFSEKRWLGIFIQERIKTLKNNTYWKDTVSRVHALQSFADKDNFELKGTMAWTVYGDNFTLETPSAGVTC